MPETRATAPDQNTLPITAASCSSDFNAGGRASMRAPISDWRVSGTGIAASGIGEPSASRLPSRIPRSASIRTNSSANSGFPPLRSISMACVSLGSTTRSRRPPIRPAVSPSVSGGSTICVALRDPRPQSGRRSKSSGRVAQSSMIGECASRLDELVDEVQERGVGPVQVLEDEHERGVVRERLEEAAPCGEQVVARDVPAGVAEPEQRSEPRAQPVALLLVGERRGQRRVELLVDDAGRIVVQDARLGLHHLAERPEAHPFAVGETSPLSPTDEIGELFHVLGERRDDPGLADPGLARDGDEPQRLVVVPALADWSTRRKIVRSCASSSARPTNGVAGPRGSMPVRANASIGRQIGSGSPFPFTVTGSSAS